MGRDRGFDSDSRPPRRGSAGTRAQQDTGGNDVGERSAGFIKRLVKDKGFGFIKEDGTGAEIFFHRSETDGMFDAWQEGQKVSFQPQTSPKGPRAAQVQAVG